MQNRYKIDGDVTIISIERSDGTIIETFIDTADLDRLKEFNRTWHASKATKMNSFYINTNLKVSGKHKIISLHRFLTNAPDGYVVDHIDGNPLNNRRSNLRVCRQAENVQNTHRIRSDNTSGFKGVSWSKEKRKWHAYVKVNGKRKHIGYFNDLEVASKAVAMARSKLMPFSQEALTI
jgi:hypothetical protein